MAMMDSLCRTTESVSSLIELLECRSSSSPNRVAYSFIGDDEPRDLTYGELNVRARAVAGYLQQTTRPGDRALLLFPAGLDFVSAFFGCVYAGVLAVPACYPKPKRPIPRLTAIARDASATVVLTNSKTLETTEVARNQPELRDLSWLAVETISSEYQDRWECPNVGRDDLLFLQYTSGSTTNPKGVMVSHDNLLHNLEVIRSGFGMKFSANSGDETEKGLFWLPAYHDMGLIGGILTSLYVGGQSVLMSPTDFLRRPMRWLEAISEARAKISGAPNFAYDLCVEKATEEDLARIDLSCWELGFCGAEPIRAETLERFYDTFSKCGFASDALYPCYGLAESTLLAAGPKSPMSPVYKRLLKSALSNNQVVDANGAPREDVQRLVGCGSALLDNQIMVVDPEHLTCCAPDRVGEIWIRGPSVARGYWNRPEETALTFQAKIADSDEGPFMRTGDLGFISDGNLYVTGRIKDVIIIRGRNLYPQDIEYTASQSNEALIQGAAAAFSYDVDGQERLAIVQEVNRRFRGQDLADVIGKIRGVINEQHDVDPNAIVLIRQASLPMTTSGKVQRSLCREQFQDGGLRVLEEWVNSNGRSHPVSRDADGRPVAGPSENSNGSNGRRSNNGDNRLDSAYGAKSSVMAKLNRNGNGSTQVYSADEIDRLSERVESWLIDWLSGRAGVAAENIHRDKPFAEYGLDSLTAVELSHEIEQWLGVQVTATVAWNYPTVAAMAGYLAREVADSSGDNGAAVADDHEPGSDFERVLAEIEMMSEGEAEKYLDKHGSTGHGSTGNEEFDD